MAGVPRDVDDRICLMESQFHNRSSTDNTNSFSVEALQDALIVLYEECRTSSFKKESTVEEFVKNAKPVVDRITELRLSAEDFDTLEVIGRGAFGEVKVVKMKGTGKVYALKILNKVEMLKRHQTACFREERDVLVFGDQDWITTLHYAFQDKTNLYFVMDYYVGGDVLTLLSKYEDHLPEPMARFYASEMVVAIDSIHKLGYVHRDIKPDNVLIDKDGHIKLADFGSCLKVDSKGKVNCTTAVGTPDYISPEILQAMEDGKGVYGKECDWWSLGICLYEMLFGETPFYAESLLETYGKIMQHKSRFKFLDVSMSEVSKEARDLINMLICDPGSRLGRNGVGDFKPHPFFSGVDWDNLRQTKPPYSPEYSSPTDTRNFELLEDNDSLGRPHTTDPYALNKVTALTVHLPFVGFTYTHNSKLCDRPPAPEASGGGDASAEVRRERSRLQREVESLKEQLATRVANEKPASSGGELTTKMRTLERTSRTLKSDKSQLQEEIAGLREELAGKDKDVREAKAAYREAQDEITRITDKLNDTRAQKMKYSRLAREKEEEIEEKVKKIETLRKANRESERERRGLLQDLEEMRGDLKQALKQKNRAEAAVAAMEEELNNVKSAQRRSGSRPGSRPATEDSRKEIQKLQAQLEEKEADLKDSVSSLRTKHTAELQRLKEMLAATETTNTDLQKENSDLQLKLARSRNQSMRDIDQGLKEKSDKWTKEKKAMMDEKKELQAELDKVTTSYEQLKVTKKEQESELSELRHNKELLTQWEQQIVDIIQWVTEEKDARAYLKSMAKKLADDVDGLKSTANTLNRPKEEWMERRTLRRDRQDLQDLQLSLQSEIDAKSKIAKDLTDLKAHYGEMESRVAHAEAESARLKKENEKLLTQMQQSRLGSRSDSSSHFFSSGVYSSPEPKQQAPPPTSKSSKTVRKVGVVSVISFCH
jgi:serine/threonine-protein kinase MRCK